MGNFEIFDNTFQLVLLLSMCLATNILHWRTGDHRYFILGCGYSSFFLGTLFYLLHLVILTYVPQIFYVSEISWLGSYLFFLSLLGSKWQREKGRFYILPGLVAVLVFACSMGLHIFGPSPLLSISFATTIGAIVFLSVSGLKSGKNKKTSSKPLYLNMVLLVLFQLSVYLTSVFTTDYTRFNLYFTADILLTLTMAGLLFSLHWEVSRK